jgi:MFS family permease
VSQNGAGVIIGRMIQGAAGSTILACGMSLLSVAASGAAQMRAITLWGAASAAGAALGPLAGGLLVDSTGWQGLFWIDAAIAAACIPLTVMTVQESRDPTRPHSIDVLGTLLIAVILVPVVLALSEGSEWGWSSVATIGCLVLSAAGVVGFVFVERRQSAPLVDLQLFANRALVGATIAILIVAGVLNGLMYVLSLYFQDPDAYGMSAFEAGLATLPAAGALIAITPLITPLAMHTGTRAAIGLGFIAATVGLAVMAFVQASWVYGALVAPLVVIAAGLGLSNGPASAASTAVVSPDEVGQASGISNMARYVGGSLAVAAVGAVYSSVIANHRSAGASASDALATGLSRSALLMAIMCGAGILLAVVAAIRHRPGPARPVDRAAAAAAATHTIPSPAASQA